ncbi:MAG: TIR domain-containing protein [Anaerolineae bacterium]|nr:TIR domain-containing protein [Anaerolineae bacterium]
MPRIFISYRKADSAAYAERIDRLLHDIYKRKNVMVNLVALPEETLQATIQKTVATCDVVLVVIGSKWLKVLDSRGIPRLYNPDDMNRVEIETAIKTKRTIIPVLVDGAAMPSPDDLPPALRELASLNAIVLRPEPDFAEDFKRLRWVIDGAFPGESTAQSADSSSTATILIIEDTNVLMKEMEGNLSFEGFKVITAENGLLGIELAKQHRPDIIICDIMMPELDGYGVLEKIRSDPNLATTLFMFSTSKGERSEIRLGMELTADDYLTKPFTSIELINAVNALLKKRALGIKQTAQTPQKPLHAHQIFLSYSRRDTQVMQRLRDDLRTAKLSVWVDEEGLEPGTPAWEAAIGKAIRGANCVLVVLSPDAEQSMWVGRELAMAETLNKRIFPVLVRGTEQDAIPFRLMTHQWIDARQDYASAFDKLLGAVKKHLR